MKRNSLLLLVFVLSSIYFIATSSSNGRATAANSGNTGAPSESQVCGNCHNGGAYGTVNLTIQVFAQGTNIPVSAYVPGTTYDVRVTVQNSSGNPAGYGFQLTCLTTPGNSPLAGYTNLASNVKQKTVLVGTVAGRTYVEHNGVLPNNQFNFSWTAPAAGTGSVRMFSAGNAVNGTGGTGGDNGGSTSITIPEAQQLVVSSSAINPTCANTTNGSINITISSGNAPYTFLWNDGNMQEDRNALGAGSYSVVVTDNLGLSQTLSFTLNAPQPIEASFTIQDALFFGGTGSFDLDNLTGGTPPYTAGVEPFSDLSQLPAGDYQFVVTDVVGCTSSFDFTVNSPADLEANVSIENVSCTGLSDGQINPVILGGVPPYTFVWNDGITELNRTSLSSGTYTLTVTDDVEYAKDFSFTIIEPQPLAIQNSIMPIACFGGQAQVTITASGGTGSYNGTGTFSVPAGEFEATVTDIEGCSNSIQLTIAQPEQIVIDYLTQPLSCTGETGLISFTVSGGVEPFLQTFSEESISNPGLYNYEFIDANNCSSIIDVNVPAIDGFEIISSIENNSCFQVCDGQISLSAPDAQGTASFNWQDGATLAQRIDLCPGTYTVAVTDENNCTITSSFTITEPSELVIDDFEIIQTTPDGVEIELQVAGGTEPYSYAWTTGTTNVSALIPFDESHDVIVSDANGCEVSNEVSFFFVNLEESQLTTPRVYPNPAQNFIIIDDISSTSELQLWDMTGRMIMKEQIQKAKTQVNLEHIESGNYLLRIVSKNQEFSYRMNIR